MPTARKFFGDMAVAGVLAHEYGYAIQNMARLVKRSHRPGRRAASGLFRRRLLALGRRGPFTLDTGDGRNKVLAGVITTTRDPADVSPTDPDAHGTALERVSAFQLGFTSGAAACADISALRQPVVFPSAPCNPDHRVRRYVCLKGPDHRGCVRLTVVAEPVDQFEQLLPRGRR